jgi:prolyl-tRNA synthetase
MRYSKLFGKTIRKVPKDAQLASHQLLFKAGFIRRFSTGRWGFLPLGMKVWLKIAKIIEEEMDAIGCQRMIVPTLHPIEVWRVTARDQAFGEEMLVVDDHHGATFAIGATAEGMMLELVKMFNPSYKDLPIDIYQFSQKFRDDKRPRGGLVRVREFMMKDAYNFCANEKQLVKGYQKYYDAYLKISKRLGLKVTPVLADSGAIGGGLSHEFMYESKEGDQTYFVCDQCGYAANIDKCEFERVALNPQEKVKAFKIIDQPEWVCTMEDNVKHYCEPKWRYLKNVVYKDEKGKIFIASLRGDQAVNEVKLKRFLGTDQLEPATEKDLKKIGTKPGYVHSWGIKGVTFVGDLGLPVVKNYIGGQKEKTTDSANVNYGRDFKYKTLADIVEAKNGDPCAKCKTGHLREKKGFEWGHTFKIDTLYSQGQEGYYIDKKGRRRLLWMGSYGIGLGRTMSLIVEAYHDKKGIIWPKQVAPYQAHLLVINNQQSAISKTADKAYQKLLKAEVEVLYDNRDISAGIKFADADLIGTPVRLVISSKTGDKIEWKERHRREKKLLTLTKAIKLLQERR